MLQTQIIEARIILAIEAKQTNPSLSLRKLAQQFDVPRTTLQYGMAGRVAAAQRQDPQARLTQSEEDAVFQYIVDQDARGFPPQRVDVQEIANLLMAKRDAQCVGKCWTDRFIKRRPELCTRFSRTYDYQRALLEDPNTLNV